MGLLQGTPVNREGTVSLNGQTFRVDGGSLMKKVGDQDHKVVSFVDKTTHQSYSPDGLRDQISNGIVKRDWSDLVAGTWAFTIFQLAATVTGVGLFVKSLDFAYNALKASSLLNDAFAAGRAAWAYIATQGSVARTGTAALQSAANAASAAKRCIHSPEFGYIPDQGDGCTFWLMPKVDPAGQGGPGGFPSESSWDQGLNDFAGYMGSQGLDRAEGSVSEGGDHPAVFGLECGGVQTEKDQC
ncbi:unnamed protein product [Sympodiomycopsis kandeliae]